MEFVAEKENQKNKFKKMNKNPLFICILVLGFLVLYLNLSDEDELQHNNNSNIAQARRANNIADGFTTLGLKFVNFCIAKSLRYRTNIPYLETEASKSIKSWMFWIILTNSIWRVL